MTVIKNRKSISASQKYFDDLARAGYSQSADYQQILFKPGKALQSRELNFLQSIINEKIKKQMWRLKKCSKFFVSIALKVKMINKKSQNLNVWLFAYI
jgi:hypothetical protein